MPVKATEHNHLGLRSDVEHAVRKLANERTPDVPVHRGERERVALDGLEALVERP
jgi:hypothetical protein